MERILFITPPYHAGVVESAGSWMPLGFVYLAGAVRAAGFEAEIYDAMTKQHSQADIADYLREASFDVVAVSAITSTLPASLDVLRIAKSLHPSVTTILGGVHPTFCYDTLLAEHADVVDFIIRGEGEHTLPDLLTTLRDGGKPGDVEGLAWNTDGVVQYTPARAFLQDIDDLPAAWDLIDWTDYRYYVIPGSTLAAVSTSRGCTHECTFCSQQKFWNKTWRARSPAKVTEEIDMLHRRYGANVFLLVDEYPTSDRERWEEVLDRLIEARNALYILMETRVEDIVRDADIMWKYRAAGIVHVYVGVEATTQETLDHIKKDSSVEQSKEAIDLLHEHGIITETSFVLGFPGETPESIAATLSLAKHYGPDFAHFLAITPWPYADIYSELAPNIEVHDFARYNLVEPIVRPDSMTRDELRTAMVECYARYYMSKVPEYFRIRDSFKREYLKRSMKLIMNNSFLTELIRSSGAAKEFSRIHEQLAR